MSAGWQQGRGAGPREMPPSWYSRHRAGSADTCPEAGAGNQELYSELRDRSEIASDLCFESQESESSRKHPGLVGFLFCFVSLLAGPPRHTWNSVTVKLAGGTGRPSFPTCHLAPPTQIPGKSMAWGCVQKSKERLHSLPSSSERAVCPQRPVGPVCTGREVGTAGVALLPEPLPWGMCSLWCCGVPGCGTSRVGFRVSGRKWDLLPSYPTFPHSLQFGGRDQDKS